MVDYVIPTTIPTSAPGAALAVNVTAQLQTFIDTIDVNVGGRLLFQPNRVYHSEKTLKFTNNKNLTIDGQGAAVQATVAAINSSGVGTNGVVTGCTIGPPTWVYGTSTIKTITAPAGTTPFVPLVQTSFLSWYIVNAPATETRPVDGRGQGFKDMSGIGQPNVPAMTSSVIHILNGTADAPADGTSYDLKFTSPLDRSRANFQFDNCKNIIVTNLEIIGANPKWLGFNKDYEAQGGLYFSGGTDGLEISNCNIHHQWGDNITLQAGAGIPLKNVNVHDNDLHHATRQTVAIGGLIDATFTRNNMRSVHRHIFDIEPNGGNQTCQRITINDNDMSDFSFGVLAISAYGGLPMFIGDITLDNNRIVGNLNIPVGTNHDQPATQPRWGPFTFTNNTATASFGTGTMGTGWTNAPGLIKFLYCDGVTVTGNVLPLQPGRLMYAVWCEHCTGINVHGNHDQTATDPFVAPHHELFGAVYNQGFATFKGGGHFSAVGVSVLSTHGSAQFKGGADFSAVGKGRNYASSSAFLGGGTFSATGAGKSYGTATFSGGGDFSAVGLGQNYGFATFNGDGTFAATGRGVNYGTATFDGGDVFTATGQSKLYGTATFSGGGSFSALGIGQNFGRATFSGGGAFTAVGSATTYGTATFNGGGTFTAIGAGQNRAFFDGGGTFTAVGRTRDERGYQDGDWLVGAVKLRGPGWDDMPWDTTPWDGEE